MKIKQAVKVVGGVILSYGMGNLVGNIINSTTPESDGKLKKATVGIAGVALGWMLTDRVIKYYEKQVDQTAKTVEKAVENGDLS